MFMFPSIIARIMVRNMHVIQTQRKCCRSCWRGSVRARYCAESDELCRALALTHVIVVMMQGPAHAMQWLKQHILNSQLQPKQWEEVFLHRRCLEAIGMDLYWLGSETRWVGTECVVQCSDRVWTVPQ